MTDHCLRIAALLDPQEKAQLKADPGILEEGSWSLLVLAECLVKGELWRRLHGIPEELST